MRIGSNPQKVERKIILTTHHRVVIVVYLPNEEGFYKESFDVFTLHYGCVVKIEIAADQLKHSLLYNHSLQGKEWHRPTA